MSTLPSTARVQVVAEMSKELTSLPRLPPPTTLRAFGTSVFGVQCTNWQFVCFLGDGGWPWTVPIFGANVYPVHRFNWFRIAAERGAGNHPVVTEDQSVTLKRVSGFTGANLILENTGWSPPQQPQLEVTNRVTGSMPGRYSKFGSCGSTKTGSVEQG